MQLAADSVSESHLKLFRFILASLADVSVIKNSNFDYVVNFPLDIHLFKCSVSAVPHFYLFFFYTKAFLSLCGCISTISLSTPDRSSRFPYSLNLTQVQSLTHLDIVSVSFNASLTHTFAHMYILDPLSHWGTQLQMDMHSSCVPWKRKLELDTWACRNVIPLLSLKASNGLFLSKVLKIVLNRVTCGHWRVLSYYWIWGLDKKNRLPEAAQCPNPAWKTQAFHNLSPLPHFISPWLQLPF